MDPSSRATRLHAVSTRLLGANRFGTPGYERGRHALFLAALLEMRVAPRLFAALRRRSKRDVQQHRWYDDRHDLELTPSGDVVLGAAHSASDVWVGQ